MKVIENETTEIHVTIAIRGDHLKTAEKIAVNMGRVNACKFLCAAYPGLSFRQAMDVAKYLATDGGRVY